MTDMSIGTAIFCLMSAIVAMVEASSTVRHAEYSLVQEAKRSRNLCILAVFMTLLFGFLTLSEVYVQTKWDAKTICPETQELKPTTPTIIIPPTWKGYDAPESRPTTA